MAPRFPEIPNVGSSNPCFLRRTWEEDRVKEDQKIMSQAGHVKTKVTLRYPRRVIK